MSLEALLEAAEYLTALEGAVITGAYDLHGREDVVLTAMRAYGNRKQIEAEMVAAWEAYYAAGGQ